MRQAGLICALALSTGRVGAADYSTTLSSLNPLAYWQLNEPTQPVVPTYLMTNSGTAGAALNGLYFGVPTLQAPGPVAGDPAVSFSGNLQYTETPFNAALNPTGPFTVEFWAYLTNDTAGAKSGVVSRYVTVPGGPTGQFGYLFFCNNTQATFPWQFRVYNGTGNTTINDAMIGDVQPNTWYHVVGVYDGANAHIYVNGLKTSTTTGTVVYAPNTNAPTRIGAGTPETSPSLFFPGSLDNVAIYHSVLTDSQIAAHYEAATTNAVGYNAQILADNPAVYYPMNEPVLPPYVPYPATNSGTLGSPLNGAYSLAGSSSGVAGPARDQFAGFAVDNRAVRLNASGTAGRVTFPPVTGMTTDHATISCWVRRAGSQVDTAPMFFHEATSGSAALNFQYTTRNLAYHWEDSSTTHWSWTSGLLVPDDVWTFVALVVTPTNGIMYMGSTNGLSSRTNVSSHAVHDFSSSAGVMGAQLSRADRYLKGWLDEVALFDKPLDYDTISNLFYSATPAIPLVTRTPDPLYEGMTVSFTAYGVAAGPVNYQWRKDGGNLGGKTSSTLSLVNVATNDSGSYDVVVTFGANSVTSAVSAITVIAGPPVIFAQPVSATRFAGATVPFSVSAGGSVPLSYQWQKNSNNIAGATASTYTLTGVTAADAGYYRAMLANPYGTNYTTNVTLTVLNVTNYAAAVMSGAPLAYWRMSETSGTTAFDYAGGHDGTLNGSVTTAFPGPQPPAFAGFEGANVGFGFNGSSTYVSGMPPLNYTGNQATMVAWVRRDGPQVATAHILSHRSGTGNTMGLHMDNAGSGILYYTWADLAGTYNWNSGLTLPDGTWAFVALVIEPNGATMYMDDGVNGLQSARHNFSEGNVSFTGAFQVGRDARGDRYWNGGIDEVAFYGYSLNADQISNLRFMGISGPTPPAIVTQPESRSVFAGQSVSFTVRAVGAEPMSYQWKRNGANIPGATVKTLPLTDVDYSDAGAYSVAITNSQGFTNSQAAALTVAATPTFANLTNRLVLHLKFDVDAQDSSGRGNHGTPVGATSIVAGKLGNALHYNTEVASGTYNYVTLGTPADLQFGYDTNFSVAYWVRFTGLPGDLPFLCSAAGSWSTFGLTFAPAWQTGGWSYSMVGDMGNAQLYGAAGSVNDGNWHSLVHTFNRTGNAVTYLDGVEVDVRAITGVGGADSGLPFCIGQDPTGTYGVDGQADIDDLGIWQRALNATEAQSVYLVGMQGRSFDTYGPVTLQLRKSGSDIELIWETGTLESAEEVGGPYNAVGGASAPYHKVSAGAGKKFYRVKL